MAVRNGPMRRIPGNPLGGLLQQTARKARSTSRNRTVAGPVGPEGPQGPPGTVEGVIATAVTVLTCDETGVAVWDFPTETPVPVIVATPVGVASLSATVLHVDPAGVAVLVTSLDGTETAGATVHVVLFNGDTPVESA